MSNWWDDPHVPWAIQHAYNTTTTAPPPPKVTTPPAPHFRYDSHLLDYAVLVFSGQNQWDITELLLTIGWTESFSTPAIEMDISIAAPTIRSTVLESDAAGLINGRSQLETAQRRGPSVNLNNLIKLGMGVRVFASRPDPSGVFLPLRRLATGTYSAANEIFRGYIFQKSRSGSVAADALSFTAYDQMVYLGKNDYDTIFKNASATHIIRSLCERAGLNMAPVGKDFSETHAKISRLVSYGNNLYDCCYLAIQKHKHITGKYYRLRSEGGRVVLRQRTTPATVWTLTDDSNITESQFSESIEDLVTGVQPKVTGKAGRSAYLASKVNADLERLYGRMRKVEDLTNLKSSEVPKAVQTFLKENGKPKVEAAITFPCVNSIRAGDLIKVRESDTGITGLWYISSVSHSISPTIATTNVELVKTAQEAEVQTVTENTPDGTKSTNRHVTYDKIRGHDGKTIRYRVTAGIFTPSGKFDGETLQGDELIVKLGKGLASNLGKSGSHVQLQYGRLSIRCVVQTRGDYAPYDVMVSTSAAQHLGIQNGNHIFIYPLRRHTTGGTGGGPHATRYDSMIIAAGNKYNVSPSLIKGVMEQESSFNPGSISSAGAVGLMQVMPGTAASMGWSSREGSLTSPSISIKYGTKYLHIQLGTFHSIRLALAAYNGGPGVARRPESSWPTETRNYVRIVMKNYEKYKQGGFG